MTTNVKKHFTVFVFIILLVIMIEFPLQAKECPNSEQLVEASLNERDDLLRALGTIVPNQYAGEQFSDWEIVSATPFPMTVGKQDEQAYFEIANNFCGGNVAEKSWLVRLHFPKLKEVSASLTEGQLFVAKSKEVGWFVWYQYH